jgi:hypothetical protein
MSLRPLKAPSSGATYGTQSTQSTQYPLAMTSPAGPAPASAALNKHATWFDVNNDGVVQVKETAQRFHELGVGGVSLWVSSAIATLALHKQTDSKGPVLDTKAVATEKGFGKTSVGLLRNHDRTELEADLNHLFGDKRTLTEGDFEQAINDNAKKLVNDGHRVEYADLDRSHLQWKLLFRLASERDGAGTPVLTRSRLREFFDPQAESPISFFANLAQRRVALLDGTLQPGSASGTAPGSVTPDDAAAVDRVASDKALMEEKGVWGVFFSAHFAARAGLKELNQK